MGRRGRAVAALVALCAATAAGGRGAWADWAPVPGPAVPVVGSLVGPQEAWTVAETAVLSVADLDPVSGALVSGQVSELVDPALATVQEMADAGALAVDAVRLAEEARRRAAAQRRAAGPALRRREDPGVPADWEMTHFSGCGDPANARFRARIETVEAFEAMCRAAAADGVALVITSAFRDPDHQRRLWEDALRRYGSVTAARKWVAPSDGEACSSKHCSGIAIDVTRDGDPGRAWMHQVVGCWDGSALRGLPCGTGTVAVRRLQTYGFVAPMAHEPWHIELGLPAGGGAAADCRPAESLEVPAVVAAVFRCRLTEAGIVGPEAERVVREALLVSRCESGWNPAAVAYGGRWVDEPHPLTGLRYTATGLFQFVRATGDRWIDGGWANARDPVANADAAARLYLHNRAAGRDGWADWTCATGGGGRASVLPGRPGGPADFPDWVRRW